MSRCDNCGLPRRAKSSYGEDENRGLCTSCATLLESTPRIRVRPLEDNDLELVMAWRSNLDIHQYFRAQDGPLKWDEHVIWFESRSADRYDFVISTEGRRVGVVSLDENNEVGIFLGDFAARGRGVATRGLEWICDRFEDRTPLFAEIHEENGASQELFGRCGFEERGRDGQWLRYVYDP